MKYTMNLTTEAALKVLGLLAWMGMPSGSDRFIMTLEESISRSSIVAVL